MRLEVLRKKQNQIKSRALILCVQLHRIQKSLAILQHFWKFFEESGNYVLAKDSSNNLGYGSAQKYFTENEYKEYNRRLDEALKQIGIINKELYAIKLNDLVLSEELKESFIGKINRLRASLNNLLQSNMNITERLQSVKHTITISSDLVGELYAAIGQADVGNNKLEGGEYLS